MKLIRNQTDDAATARAEQAIVALKNLDDGISSLFWTSDDGTNQRSGNPEDDEAPPFVVKPWKASRDILSTSAPTLTLAAENEQLKRVAFQAQEAAKDLAARLARVIAKAKAGLNSTIEVAAFAQSILALASGTESQP